MRDAFICDGVRTPVGRYGGALSAVRTDDLGAVPLRALLARVDLLVTQRGVAVNPKNVELMQRLKDADLPVMDIHQLKDIAEGITDKPQKVTREGHTVANVIYRDGSVIDHIRSVK